VNDLLRLYAVNGISVLVLLTAWWVAAGSVRTTTGVSCAAVGVAAVIASGTANCRWVLVGRRSVAARRNGVTASVEHLASGLERGGGAGVTTDGADRLTGLVALPESTRYHRPDCQLVAGKLSVTTSSATAHERAGRRRCGMCQP
jgi:hypothetical protein